MSDMPRKPLSKIRAKQILGLLCNLEPPTCILSLAVSLTEKDLRLAEVENACAGLGAKSLYSKPVYKELQVVSIRLVSTSARQDGKGGRIQIQADRRLTNILSNWKLCSNRTVQSLLALWSVQSRYFFSNMQCGYQIGVPRRYL